MCFHSKSVIGPPRQLRCKSSRPPNKCAHMCCTLYTPHDCSLDKIVIFLVLVAKYLCINCMCFECRLKPVAYRNPHVDCECCARASWLTRQAPNSHCHQSRSSKPCGSSGKGCVFLHHMVKVKLRMRR